MIIMPINNRNRILNVEVSLKNVVKIAKGVNKFDINPSDIVVNNNRYSDSSFSSSVATPNSVMTFIRNSLKKASGSILISTKQDENGCYDIYELKMLDEKVSDGIDNIFGTLILALKNENENQKGRYLDLKKLNAFDLITNSKIKSLEYAKDNMQYLNISKYIDENDLRGLFKLVNVINDLDFTIISKSIINEDMFLNTIKFLEPTNSKDYNNLNNYYALANDNKNEYSKLSYLYKIVNDKPLDLIHASREKVKVYTDEHMDEAS